MTPEHIQEKIESAAFAERIYEPKYGGKDHSGYDTMMKYEVNYERDECFQKGAIFGYELAASELEAKDKAIDKLEHQNDDLQNDYSGYYALSEIQGKAIQELVEGLESLHNAIHIGGGYFEPVHKAKELITKYKQP